VVVASVGWVEERNPPFINRLSESGFAELNNFIQDSGVQTTQKFRGAKLLRRF